MKADGDRPPRIRLPPSLRKSAPEHRVVSPTEEQCERVMDVPEARRPEERARIVAFDVFRENFGAAASLHHRTRTEGSMSAENHRQRIEHKTNL